MAVTGTPRIFHVKWKFLVEIDGFGYAGFQSCSELSVEAAETQQYEGGVIIPDKQPAKLTIADITLMRGATDDLDMFRWMQEVGDASKNAGLAPPAFKRTLTIVQQGRDGRTQRRWRVFGAWPKKFVAGDWDNDSDDNVIEQLVLAIDRFALK
jgi:phage tail-like protein